MATDMDIDMDLDIPLMDEDFGREVEIIPDVELSTDQHTPILSVPNDTSEADSHQPVPEKVHLRGLDNLTNDDVRNFASEHFSAHKPVRIEWINDTSANLIYESADIAGQALVAFAAVEVVDVSQIPILQTLAAKSFPLHPNTRLEVRVAVLGDRKEAGARHKSRFYLLNPEYDPAERRNRGGNRYRDRDESGRRRQKYDDREHRKRQERDANEGFDSSLYDDDESALAKRRDRRRRRDSSSRSNSRGRLNGRDRGGKELFPDRDGESGRLRDRSASPARDDEREIRRAEMRKDLAAAANREKSLLIKAALRETQSTKELFPRSPNGKHRRSDAFDAADETADLFSSRMRIPLMDGGSDERPLSLASRVTNRSGRLEHNSPAFNIRGAAKPPQPQSFNIKGASKSVKELFPSTLGDNSGKELFSERLEGRGRKRQKAEDLFH